MRTKSRAKVEADRAKGQRPRGTVPRARPLPGPSAMMTMPRPGLNMPGPFAEPLWFKPLTIIGAYDHLKKGRQFRA